MICHMCARKKKCVCVCEYECVCVQMAGLAQEEPGREAHILAARVLWLTAPRCLPACPHLVGQFAQLRPVSVSAGASSVLNRLESLAQTEILHWLVPNCRPLWARPAARSLGTSTHKRTPPCLGWEEPAPSWTEWPRQQLCPPHPWKRSKLASAASALRTSALPVGTVSLLVRPSPPSPFRWQLSLHAHPPAP